MNGELSFDGGFHEERDRYLFSVAECFDAQLVPGHRQQRGGNGDGRGMPRVTRDNQINNAHHWAQSGRYQWAVLRGNIYRDLRVGLQKADYYTNNRGKDS